VPITETGTASSGISVARALRRNANTTSATRTSAPPRLSRVSRIEARTNSVVSNGVVQVMPGGKSRASAAMRVRSAAITASALAPGCRKMPIGMAGPPPCTASKS